MKLMRRLAVLSAAAALATGIAVAIAPPAALAHGVMLTPGARTYLCYVDGLRSTGEIISYNPACAAAVASGGTQPLYDWFGVLRSDAGGRTTGFIPDGSICSGGNPKYAAYDAARTDWPVTHLTSGAQIEFHYSNWAAHPGSFNLYITRDGWSPTTPLAWADLVPFASTTNPPATGPPGAFNYYFWTGNLPVKTGRHILFAQWVRSDSQENFFSCSDVVFDGGHGEVTGVGPNGNTQPTPPPTSAPPTAPPTTNPPTAPPTTRPPTAPPTTNPPTNPPTSPPPGNGACTATFRTANAWAGNFQGEVTVKAGTTAVTSWTVSWVNPAGQAIAQLWNGVLTTAGANVTVANQTWNGTIPAGGSQLFGFLATTAGVPAATGITCTAH
jgi:predicted carbohydrate-binding protein with CBM5 and CBM33 domain